MTSQRESRGRILGLGSEFEASALSLGQDFTTACQQYDKLWFQAQLLFLQEVF